MEENVNKKNISFADYYDANVFEIGNNGNNKVKKLKLKTVNKKEVR